MITLEMKYQGMVKEILAQYLPGIKVCVFGSRVTKNPKPFSDLDLVIMGDHAIDSTLIYKITDAFEESDLPIRVDVVDWHRIDESFKKIIQPQCVTLQAAGN